MRSDRGSGPLSLRARILIVGSLASILLVLSSAYLSFLQWNLERSLASAVSEFAEEQRLADGMSRSVMEQILGISAPDLASGSGSELVRFEEAGREVHRRLREFLDRPLSQQEREVLERLRELHQEVEVSASMSWNQSRIGDSEAAAAWRESAGDRVFEFLAELDRFLELRREDLARIQQEQGGLFRFILWSRTTLLLLFVSIFAGLAAWIHRRVTPPLEDVFRASERVAEGDLSARVALSYDPEFDTVARGFNEMATRLEGARSELEERNRELTAALDEVRRAQGELILSEKMAALGRVSAGLAHELNNPLASVMGFAELLDQRYADGDPPTEAELREEFLQPIVSEGERARDLVRTFLDFSRRPDQPTRPVSLRKAFGALARMREDAFVRAGLVLDLGEVPDAWVAADPELLQSVLLNLVANAFDAMAPQGHGRLRVHGARDGDEVVLEFEDEGPGFADVDRVFEPFYTTKDPGAGTGLGMALSHRFVLRFGGTIRVENRASGGARVTLRLPGAEEPAEAAPPAAVTRTAGARAPAPPLTPLRDGPPTVLVVDDEQRIRRLQVRILERMGVRALEGASTAEARALLERGSVDVIVSDVKMPGESGIELYRWVRSRHPELAERFLFVSGDMSHPELAAIESTHPGMVLLKPFSMQDYQDRLSRVLGLG